MLASAADGLGATTLASEAEAGETYYVEGSIGMGVLTGRPDLAPSSTAAFEAIEVKLQETPPLAGSD
jgi:hypothetical protein